MIILKCTFQKGYNLVLKFNINKIQDSGPKFLKCGWDFYKTLRPQYLNYLVND